MSALRKCRICGEEYHTCFRCRHLIEDVFLFLVTLMWPVYAIICFSRRLVDDDT
jgi:hypothetical protein